MRIPSVDECLNDLWPEMMDLPQRAIEHSAQVYSNRRGSDGLSRAGAGVFSTAFFSDSGYVVKSSPDYEPKTAANDISVVFGRMAEPLSVDEEFADFVRNLISPSTILFDRVVVQEPVVILGTDYLDIGNLWPSNKYDAAARIVDSLSLEIDKLAATLLIDDMHTSNWGIDANGNVRMFDLMPNIWPRHRFGAAHIKSAYARFKRVNELHNRFKEIMENV